MRFSARPALAVLITLLSAVPAGASGEPPEVVVVGATPAGIAAAVAAAREGRWVVLVAGEDHIGGIVSNGLTNSDISNNQAVGGLFREFTRRVLRHYQTSADASTNVPLCHNGYWYEPSVAERVFRQMIDEQQGRVVLLLKHALRQAVVTGGRLSAIVVEGDGGRRTLTAGVFIDATYEGDLAALAGVPYRIGREGKEEFGEPHAGLIYARFGTTEPLPGSTGQADRAIQAFCFRFHMTDDAANRVPVARPRAFVPADYQAVLADLRARRVTQLRQVIQFYSMPNRRYEVNSDHPHPDTGVPSESLDLAEENWGWPEAGPAERGRLYERYLAHNVGLIWLLQHDPEVPSAIRDEARRFGWCRDEWPENGHLPRQVYVREGRRIKGEYVLTEHDGDLDPATARTRLQPTSIAIVEYAFDAHGCHKFDPSHPGVREGYIFIPHRPLQVPYGVVVPQRVDGLLVPVACSATHVAYSALRMEPVFMALGEACGTAAHLALSSRSAVQSISVADLQHRLVARGAVITHLDDVPFDHPAFAAFQWLGARGLNRAYHAEPAARLSRREGAEGLQRVLATERRTWTPPPHVADGPLLGRDLGEWLRQAGLSPDTRELDAIATQELTHTQMATLLAHTLHPGRTGDR